MSQIITQIGLGSIGRVYLTNLVTEFNEVHVHDTDSSKRSEVENLGAVFHDDVASAVTNADFILLALPDPVASRSVFSERGPLLSSAKSGAVILDLSTIDPDTARHNYKASQNASLHYVEAPVSGGEPMSAGVDGAKNGNVTFMAGSDEVSFKKALPLMDVLGQHPLLLGPAGTGSIVKLISNYISGLHNLVAAEAFALGKAAGIDLEAMLTTFAHTDANSYWLENYFAPRIRAQNYAPGFSVNLQHKDLRLCEDLARDLKVSMPLNNLGLSIYRILQAQGRGGNDLVDAVNLACELSAIEPYTAKNPNAL
ncbi:MAG: NAD(P)-dependent oxidoreductase [Pseudoruegeria sp.]